jgi:hypothetical protein
MTRRRRRGPFHYESKHEPVASPETFRRRLATSGMIAGGLLAFSLALGAAGYRWIVGVPGWVDSIHCASMIMGGMGPVEPAPTTVAGKLFASAYAIYSGVMLLASVGLLLSPGLHRILHRLHVETEE